MERRGSDAEAAAGRVAGSLGRSALCCVTASAADFIVLMALVEHAGAPVLAATAASASAGALVNFVLQRRLAFRTRSVRKRRQLPAYLSLAASTLALSTTVTALLAAPPAALHYLAARAAASVVVFLVWHYPLARWVVFRGPRPVAAAQGGGGRAMEPRTPELDLTVVIPAYNESERLPPALLEIGDALARLGRSAEVLVVDDGSTDDTVARVEALAADLPGLRVIRSEQNRGKGHAVRTGVLAARGRAVLFTDADNSVPLTEAGLLLEKLDAGADAAIGSRYAKGARVSRRQPWFRVAWSRLAGWVVRRALVPGVRDTQCGFKAFKGEVAREVFERLTIDRWGFDLEVLAILHRLGRNVVEVPVSWTDDPRSRIDPARDLFRVIGDFLRVAANAASGRYDPSPARAR